MPVSNKVAGNSTVQFADPNLTEARAIKSLVRGEATPEQQKIAWNFMLLNACGAGRDTFVPNDPNASAYLAGRRSVAVFLSSILERNVDLFRAKGETDK